MNQQGLPGSPMPDASMQQQRNSPVPFDPSQMPPGMPPQFAAGYPQMPGNPMMRPPSSHPGNFNGQMNQAQMEAMRRNPAMQNGWPQGGPPQAMMQNQVQPMGGPGGPMNPQQRNNMPPPPAPAGEQPRAEPSPSQPAAPPTPSQSNKANPKKKGTKDTGKVAFYASHRSNVIVNMCFRSLQTRKGRTAARILRHRVKILRLRRRHQRP